MSAPNTLQLLTGAIKQRRCIAIRYRDQNQIRVVEPHAIYKDEAGEVVVECFQTRGYSAGGRGAPYWRPFRVRKITALSVLGETFTPRVEEGYTPHKLKYKSGLVALVEVGEAELHAARYTYPPQPASEIGPFLPSRSRR
jgi:hypothetical protein